MERMPFLGSALERLAVASVPPPDGPLPPAAARRIVAALNRTEPAEARQPLPGELLALSLLHEVAHLAIDEAARRRPEVAIGAALPTVRDEAGPRRTSALLRAFASAFPGIDEAAAARLEDLLLVHLANANPAADPLRDLVDERALPADALAAAIRAVERHQQGLVLDDAEGGGGESLLE